MLKEKVYIYGAGEFAVSEFCRISNKYEVLGFVVSDTLYETQKIMNTPVIYIESISNKDAFFIICSSYKSEIEKTLLKKGFHNFCTIEKLIIDGVIAGDKFLKESKVIKLLNENIKKIIDLTVVTERNVINDVIVSLTSFPARFSNLELVIKSLKKQVWQPEKIILWVSYADYEKLPLDVSQLQDEQFEIRQCDDLRSYKKLIPALEQFPSKTIVTADDDLYYWPDWLRKLVKIHKSNPTAIVAHRVHRINPHNIKSYLDWEHSVTCLDSQEMSPWNFPTGVAGVLYPSGCFYPDVLNRNLFLKLCPTGDDIWFYWMFRLNNRYAIGSGVKDCFVSIDSHNSPNLYETNMFKGENNRQIENMLHHYGFMYVDDAL